MSNETKLKFQVSLFGEFSAIIPNEQTLTKCIEKFFTSGYIPNANIQELDPNTNRLEPRLSLQSIRNGITANVMFGRIDIVANPFPGSPAASLTLEEFSKQTIALAQLLIQYFSIEFHRVGFITEILFGDIGSEKLRIARDNYTNPALNIFPDQTTLDWSSKIVSGFPLPAPINQSINVSHALSQVHAQFGDQNGQKEFDTLHLIIDINTLPNQRIPSSLEAIDQFIRFATEKEQVISSTLKRVIYGKIN